jgi:hypothetical protein
MKGHRNFKVLILFYLFVFFIDKNAFCINISNVIITGNSISTTNTILSFFYEYFYEGKSFFSTSEFTIATNDFIRRLERTGWYRNLRINCITSTNHPNVCDIEVSLEEKIPYTVYLKNDHIGIGKYNIWGKGKEVIFEVGFSHRAIRIVDRMFNYSPLSYDIYLGSENFSYEEFNGNSYEKSTLVKQKGCVKIGYVFFKDNKVYLLSGIDWLSTTNNEGITNNFYFDLGWAFDRRYGFPVVYRGFYLEAKTKFYSFSIIPLLELEFAHYLDFLSTLVWANRIHTVFCFYDLPPYYKENLRDINGLRTKGEMVNLIGNSSYDIHTELRWNFWEKFPFLLFDVQLEAVVFFELGEAVSSLNAWSIPNYVYGCGLRVYLDTFAIRTELGIDKLNNISVFNSFDLPF